MTNTPKPQANGLKYLSLFSGIGGFELGIQRAIDEVEQRGCGQKENEMEAFMSNTISQPNKRQSATCIGYSEIDKYAIKVYERQFNEHTHYGDATKINAAELPDFDLLVGGFPCQSFSVAGKRAGFNDTRGTLFFDIARVLAEKRPRHLVLENVKGLLSHDQGKTFQTILGVLSDLGYRVEWQVLNSKNFGVPQNRERVYFVGHLRGECGGKVFPITGTHQPTTEHIQRHITNTLTARYEGAQATGTYIGEGKLDAQEIKQLNQPKHSNDRVYGTDGVSLTLNTMQGGNRQPFISDKPRIRRLTPTECERLQGFPDDWTKYGVGEEPISDSGRYKMCGNGVTVNVVEAVMSELFNNCKLKKKL